MGKINNELKMNEQVFGAIGLGLGVATIIGNYDIIDNRRFDLHIAKWILLVWIIVNLLICIIYKNKNEKLINIIKLGVVVVSCTVIVYLSIEYLNFLLTQLLFKGSNVICSLIMLVGCAFIVPCLLTAILYILPNMLSVIVLNIFYTTRLDNKIDKKSISKLDVPILHKVNSDAIYLYDDMKLTMRKVNTIAVTNDEKVQLLQRIKKEMNDFINKEVSECENHNTLIARFNTLDNIDLIYSKSKKYGQYLKKCDEKKKEIINLVNSRFNYINKQIEITQIGNEGEAYVNKEMDKYEYFYNLPNIRLEIKDKNGKIQSIESDNILITRYGVFVLEVKNYASKGQYNLIIERDGRWLREYKNKKEVHQSATSQNDRHVILLTKYINQLLNKGIDSYINVDGIVVIANNIINIMNYSENQKVFRCDEIYNYIIKQPVKLTEYEMNLIRDALIKDKLPPKEYEFYDHREELYYNLSRFYEFIKETEKNIEIINKTLNI